MNKSKFDFFDFDLRERRGIYFLLFLLLIINAYRIYLIRQAKSIPILTIERTHLIDSLLASSPPEKKKLIRSNIQKIDSSFQKKSKKEHYEKRGSKYSEEKKLNITHPFEANSVSYDQMLKMDIPSHLCKRIKNYRNKGGRFNNKEDLRKIYGMTESLYSQLSPWILIESKSNNIRNQEIPTISIYDINLATAEDLKMLKGIGPILSKRIVKYRDLLGGFYDLGQLAETYGLPDSTVQSMLPFLRLSANVKTLKINSYSIEELASHPYIDWKLAKIIVKYRQQHGPYLNLEDLKQIKILDEKTLNKITPYLNYENLSKVET